MIPIDTKPDGIRFKVYVQPRSSKNAIVGPHGNALKIKLTAPPLEGAANAMCIKFLSKCLRISKSMINIIAGHSSRYKTVLIKTHPSASNPTEPAALARRLRSLIKS